MNKIVQLTEREYNELEEQAKYRMEKILEIAEGMYQTRGTFKIQLEVDCQKDFYEKIDFRVQSYVNHNGDLDKFSISLKDKRRIMKFVDERATEFMQRKFGRQIGNVNYFTKKADDLKRLRWKFIGLTITGWLLATTMLLVLILK